MDGQILTGMFPPRYSQLLLAFGLQFQHTQECFTVLAYGFENQLCIAVSERSTMFAFNRYLVLYSFTQQPTMQIVQIVESLFLERGINILTSRTFDNRLSPQVCLQLFEDLEIVAWGCHDTNCPQRYLRKLRLQNFFFAYRTRQFLFSTICYYLLP